MVTDFEHINVERELLDRLDAWIRLINSEPMTSHGIAKERRAIIDTFIREELSVGGMESGLWRDLRVGQVLAAAAARIEQAHKNTKAVEILVTLQLRRINELRDELKELKGGSES